MSAAQPYQPPKICLIVARANNGVIGRDGDLPWRLRDDMAFFKSQTTGKPVIMGRKTWDSFPKRPLPKRQNIILTRNSNLQAPGAWVYSDLETALSAAQSMAVQQATDEVFIIGGAQLYTMALPRTERLYLTEIDADIDGDTYFPDVSEEDWDEVWSKSYPADERNNHKFTIRCLDRRL
ncbi:MAG: dihydrofolate reductase [Pseudomonadota bacterium]